MRRIIILLIFVLCMASVSAISDDNLTSYYDFDSDATDSKGSADGSVTGAANGVGYGIINNGYYFDGENDDITFANETEHNNIWVGGGSLSFWIYTLSDGQSDTGRIFNKFDSDGWLLQTKSESGGNVKLKIFIDFSGGLGGWETTSAVLPVGSWAHVVVTHDGLSSGDAKIYINNVTQTIAETNTPSGNLIDDDLTPLYIGMSQASSSHGDFYLDEVGIFTEALTLSDIEELYNNGNGLAYPFVAPTTYYYGFDIHANNLTASLTTFNATITDGSFYQQYSTTNGTIRTNRTTSWAATDYYNITIEATDYANIGINNYYYSTAVGNDVYGVLYEGGGGATCTGDFYVSSGCTATIINGDTYVV